ncbi:MAG: hypothetical protein M1828_002722 [Chrysothrix sp. TS-e1954]|nr:MAG: hypothetical protein M1828_002722 [Chrysothrix sp. TS-e1954]
MSAERKSFIKRGLRKLKVGSSDLRHESIETASSRPSDELGLQVVSGPDDPLVDIVFVHGLRGGALKTWRSSSDSQKFWPAEWLAKDTEFSHVRIHSYGYDAGWGVRHENPLDLQQMGVSLLEALSKSSSIQSSSGTPIIFVTFCTGGLVVKYACVYAGENPRYRPVADRTESVYFFATPHRGEQLERTLENVLWASVDRGSPSIPKSMKRDKESVRLLNDQFRYYSYGIRLIACIETVSMDWGMGKGLVVDHESATTGYPEETKLEFKLNHREMPRFHVATDCDFMAFRDSLSTTVKQVTERVSQMRTQASEDRRASTMRYLGISYLPSDDLSTIKARRLEGSCEWLTNRETFRRWTLDTDAPKFFWLTGSPGAGKSFAVSHVIEYLRGERRAYYFFGRNDVLMSNLTGLLKSILFQMAISNPSVQESLLELQSAYPNLDSMDYRVVWQKIFSGPVMALPSETPQYWIFDALDECQATEKDFETFFMVLCRVQRSIPLKVFIASRPSPRLDDLLPSECVIKEQITPADSQRDIQAFVEKHCSKIPLDDEDSQQALQQRIMNRSTGNFLWVDLVMKQFQDCHTLREVDIVLNEIPPDMFHLYERNVRRLSNKPQVKRLVKTILLWTMCALRPLSIDELDIAVRMDVDLTLMHNPEASLPSACAQLVYVNGNRRVVATHETARAFITSPELHSEYRINVPDGDLRIALACLEYLCSNQMKDSLVHRTTLMQHEDTEKLGLGDYACSFFSEHVIRAGPASDKLFGALETFLQTRILYWVEAAAQDRDLSRILRTARHLKTYSGQRARLMAPFQDDTVKPWAIDLPRILGQFGEALVGSPAAIHRLIPPLCPRKSIIHQTFAKEPDAIVLKGICVDKWSDRIACVDHKKGTAACITCRNGCIAVGLHTGSIVMYDASTLQVSSVLLHERSLRIVRFDHSASRLASAANRSIKVWETTSSSQLLSIETNDVPLMLVFNRDDDSLLAGLRSKQLLKWGVSMPSQSSSQIRCRDLHDERGTGIPRVPQAIEISLDHCMVFVTHRSMPVEMYDLDSMDSLGTLHRPGERQGTALPPINAIAFCPDPDKWLLAVAYWDEELCLFDTIGKNMVASASVSADCLVSSFDGRTLATGDSVGRINVLDFRSLEVLHCVKLDGDSITSLTFTGDDLRIVDIRGHQMNVWEPSALDRGEAVDDMVEVSNTESTHVDMTAMSHKGSPVITAVVCCYGGRFAIAGKSNACVDLYDLQDPNKALRTLYCHKGAMTEVSALAWSERQHCIASVDIANRIQVVRIVPKADNTLVAGDQILDEYIETDDSISQIVLSHSGEHLLVSTAQTFQLWSLLDKSLVSTKDWPSKDPTFWLQHPQRQDYLLCFRDFMLTLYQWQDGQQLAESLKIDLATNASQMPSIGVTAFGSDMTGLGLLARTWGEDASDGSFMKRRANKLFSIDISRLHDNASLSVPMPCFARAYREARAPEIETILGSVQTKIAMLLVFVTRDGWVCSLNADAGLQEDTFRRHLILPLTWFTGIDRIAGLVAQNLDILIVCGDKIAVISNSLDAAELDDLH